MIVFERLQRLPRLGVLILSALLLAAIGYVDFLLPFEVTMLMFYFLPIFFAAWFADRPLALAVAGLAAVTWWLANFESDIFPLSVHNWAGLNRLATFAVVALGGSAMRSQRETMRARLATLERTRELEEEIVRVSEREQMRIGQDLHDGLCQHLAAIDCAVACLKLDLEERGAVEVASASFIHEQLGSAIVEARDMARGIFPVQMEEEGFLAALEDLVATTNRLRQLRVSLVADGEIKIRDPQTGMHLFRIAQEALNNTLRHARASRVSITLRRTEHDLEMTLADDGMGLPPERAGRGIGLQTMRYRARSLEGRLEFHRSAAGGTEVRCLIPLQSAPLSDHDHSNRKDADSRGAGGGSPDVSRIAGTPDRKEGLLQSLRGSG